MPSASASDPTVASRGWTDAGAPWPFHEVAERGCGPLLPGDVYQRGTAPQARRIGLSARRTGASALDVQERDEGRVTLAMREVVELVGAHEGI